MTLDAYVDSEITTLRSDPASKVGPKGRQTTTVAGQDARLIDVLVPMKNQPKFSYVYQYILLRDNRIWTLTFGTPEDQMDAFKAISDAVVSSFGFCPLSGCTQTNTAPTAPPKTITSAQWTDPDKNVSLQYPSDWKVTKLAGSPTNLVELDGPDNVKFYVEADTSDGPPTQEMQALTDSETKDQSVVYTFDTAKDVTVGGEQGSSITYKFAAKGSPNVLHVGANWVVNHGSREYALIATDIGVHHFEIDAIIASVAFTR